MPGQPTPQDLHIDALLTMLSIAYMNEPSAYIADRVFPIIPVQKQSDRIAKYNKDFWFRDEAQLRAPGTESEGSGYGTSTDTYFCDNYAFHVDVPDEQRENADSPFSPDADAVALVTEKLLIRREKAWAADFFKTGVWGTSASLSGTDQWSDYANSDPIGNVETAKETIFKATGKEVTKLVLARSVWSKLKHHVDLIDRIKHTQRAILSVDLVGSLLEIPEILVAKALEATTKEGQATQTLDYIYGKHALFLYVPDRPGLRVPSAGYTFHWNKFGAMSFIRRIRDDKAMYDRIEGHTHFDQKATATDAGYWLGTAVA